MKPRFSLKLALFVVAISVATFGATEIATFRAKNAQAETSVVEQAPKILLNESLTKTASTNRDSKSITYQSEQLETFSVQTASLSIFLIGGVIVIVVGAAAIWKPKAVLGLVIIPQNKVGIVNRILGKPAHQLIANKGEVGVQADTLAPGWHWSYWSLIYEISLVDIVTIPSDEIGLVTAKDGAEPEAGRVFGKVVECNNFQDARAFLANGGQRGKQQAILKTGRYLINTELFEVEKKPATKIGNDEMGLVEAQDGLPLKPGQTFAREVSCNDFQNPQKFFENGGQIGKQPIILRGGNYQINPELFKISIGKFTYIKDGEVGLVEAKEGKPMPSGQQFGIAVDCDNFQDAEMFLRKGGQKGKQRATLMPGNYQINTDLFTINIVPQVEIPLDYIGLVEAKYGTNLASERIFGKAVDCNNFQDAQAFLENGGQRGKQLAILKAGTYQINTELFRIQLVPVTNIYAHEIGLVEAKDGAPVKCGQTFGEVVDCNDFQDAKAFLENGGQKGKQLAFIRTGSYYINTYIFNVKKVQHTNINSNQIGLIEALDGMPLKPGESFGKVVDCDNFQDAQAFLENGGQKGSQLNFLGTGNYQINTDLFKITLIDLVDVPQEEIGLVEAQDGANLPSDRIFGKVVECNDFQDGEAFLKNGGQRGKQLAILTTGTYQINTKLFSVKLVPVTKIASNQIGLVEAKDGADLPFGQEFGQIVDCDNFQNPHKFFENGGQKGKQLAILKPGSYYINTYLFNVNIVPVTKISSEQIGLVEANDGDDLPSGKTFGQIVDCDNFQNPHKFFENGGQRGKQLAILKPGSYYINTYLFDIKIEDVTTIYSNEIGLVEANDGKPLENGKMFGQVVECNHFQDPQQFFDNRGQRGKQLDILQEGTYYINTELFKVRKDKVVNIAPDEIGLVIANDGEVIPQGQTLGDVISKECNKFQDAQAFFDNGGQKGKQLSFLITGKYRINTDVFTVITTTNAAEYGMKPEDLRVTIIDDDKIGIVTTYDGKALEKGEIAGSVIPGHKKFQKAEIFIENGGQQGLQEEILPAGRWILNPWFVKVEQVGITEIPNGYVGVVISYIGKTPKGDDRLVEREYKGIWKTPLQTGKYPINTKAQDVVKIPINDLVLKWSKQEDENQQGDEQKDQPKIYKNLPAITVHDKNGFDFEVEVTQIIRVSKQDAPEMLCKIAEKVKSVDELIEEVLKPTVSNYFLNAAQEYEALDFQVHRSELQAAAQQYVKEALKAYNVEGIDTLIGEIYLPDQLTASLREQKIAQQEMQKLERDTELEEQRKEYEIAKESAKFSVKIAEINAQANINEILRQEEIKAKQSEIKLKHQEKQSEIELKEQEKQVELKAQEVQINLNINEKTQMTELEIKSAQETANIDIALRQSQTNQEIQTIEAKAQANVIELPPEYRTAIKQFEAQIAIASQSQQLDMVKALAMSQMAMQSQLVNADTKKAIAESLSKFKLPDAPKFLMGYGATNALQGNPLNSFLQEVSNIFGQDKSNSNLINQLLEQLGLNPNQINQLLEQLGSNEQNPNAQLNSSEPSPQLTQSNEQNPNPQSTNSAQPPFNLNQIVEPLQTPSLSSSRIQPRCPVVLLLDTSSSMAGERIHHLNAGIAAFKQKVEQHTNLLQRLDLAIATFNSYGRTVQDFVPMNQFVPPQLTAEGTTVMGKGIESALNEVENYKETYHNQNIQYRKPWVLLIMGSQPTDDWHNAAQRLKEAVQAKQINCFVVGVQGADMTSLRQITTHNAPVMLDGLKFRELFHWLTDALKNASSSTGNSTFEMPPMTEWAQFN